jgi:hypothetical protein
MPIPRGFFVILLALTAFLTMAMPMSARAQDACAAGNATDANYNQTVAAVGQRVSSDVTKAWQTMAKIDVQAMYCATNLIKKFQTFVSAIGGLTDPLGVVISLLGPQLLALVNSTCSQVMSAVTSLTTSLTALAKICIPLPSFGLKGMFNFSIKPPQCSGGTPVQMITGGSPWGTPSYANGNSLIH